jgi:hypothetical protein
MRANQWITSVSIAAIGVFLSCEPVLAQQVTGMDSLKNDAQGGDPLGRSEVEMRKADRGEHRHPTAPIR